MDLIPKNPRPALETLAWALVAFLVATAMLAYRPMPLLDDSYQYLSVAENFKRGHWVTTSLIHFDAERSHGRIPAPLTTFPPAYPAVIAIGAVHDDFEQAARFISVLCYAGTAALLAWGLMLMGVNASLRPAILLLYCTNAVALAFATSVLTEPLFILLSTGAVVGLIWAERAERSELSNSTVIARAAIANSLAGLAYYVRYAGLFLIVGLVLYSVLRLIAKRNRIRLVLLWTTLIPIAAAAGFMLRNFIVVGTWKGGNDIPVQNPPGDVIADFARAQLHLLFGAHGKTFGVWEGLLLLGGILLAFMATVEVCRPGHWSGPSQTAGALLVGACITVYCAGMFYAGLRAVISFGTRMFLPILPLYLLMLGTAVSWITRRQSPPSSAWLKLGLLMTVAGYIGVNSRDLRQTRAKAPHEVLAALYAEPTASGRPLLDWVEANTHSGDVMIAAGGQATGYLLRRPVISMVGSRFSRVHWECDEVKMQMRRFNSEYVILYRRPSPDDNFLLTESGFVAAAASSQPPCGFIVSAENSGVRILRLNPDESASQ